MTTNAVTGSPQQQKTAAAFFAKKKKTSGSLQLPPTVQNAASASLQSPQSGVDVGGLTANTRPPTGYGSILSHCPPVPPPPILKKMIEGIELFVICCFVHICLCVMSLACKIISL